MGGSGDSAQGSSVIPCAAQCHKCLTHKPSQPPKVRAAVARMQAGAARRPPSPASSATSAGVSSPSSPERPETVREEGPRATGQRRGEGAVVGKGEGKEKGGQAEAGKGGADGVAAGAEGQGEGQGQRAAEGPGADPFNVVDVRAGGYVGRKEWRSQRESVIADILEVSEDEGEGAGRMADVGTTCPGGCHEVHPPGGAEAGGRQGRTRAARGGSGRERRQQREHQRERADGLGRERAGRDDGGCTREGTPGRKGGKREWTGATVAAAPTLVQAAAAEVAPRGQCGGKGGGGEGGAPPAGGAVRGAGARGGPALSPPAPRARAGHHLPVGDAAGGDRDEGGAGGAKQRSGAGQWCGTGRGRQGQAGERGGATRATGEGTGVGGTPRSGRQGTWGDGATMQGAGEGGWPLIHGLAGVPRDGIGMVGRCSPASRPIHRPTIPAAAIPGDGDDVPAPADVPGHAATGAHAAAPAGRWDSVGSAGREGRGAQEGVGGVRGGGEEPAGVGGQRQR